MESLLSARARVSSDLYRSLGQSDDTPAVLDACRRFVRLSDAINSLRGALSGADAALTLPTGGAFDGDDEIPF